MAEAGKTLTDAVDLDDDDKCSEFSVISVYNDPDDEDLDSASGRFFENNVRISYRDPSINESDYVDDVSSVSRQMIISSNTDSKESANPDNLLSEMPQSSWNPLTLSDYVPISSVAELFDKILKEYKQNHEILASINTFVMDLKTGKTENAEEKSQSEVEKLQQQLASANAEILELERDKHNIEQHFKSAARDAEHYILRLESQLNDQCQMSKALREELDERMDELRSVRLELDTQRTIASVLQEEKDSQASKQHKQTWTQHDVVKQVENMCASYHERNEMSHSSIRTTPKSPLIRSSAHNPYGKSTLTCCICHCDCPTIDYYNYHIQAHRPDSFDIRCSQETSASINAKEEIQSNISPTQEPNRNDSSSFTERECPTPVSEFSASFFLDSSSIEEDLDSVSEAEEALSCGFRTPDEHTEDGILECSSLPRTEYDIQSGTNSPVHDSVADSMSILDVPEDCSVSMVSAVSMSSVSSCLANVSTRHTSLSESVSAVSGTVSETVGGTVTDTQMSLGDLKPEEPSSVVVETPKNEGEKPPRQPVPAQPLPLSQQPIQRQFFLCDCLCAFPSKGALITHKSYCSAI